MIMRKKVISHQLIKVILIRFPKKANYDSDKKNELLASKVPTVGVMRVLKEYFGLRLYRRGLFLKFKLLLQLNPSEKVKVQRSLVTLSEKVKINSSHGSHMSHHNKCES